MAHRLLYHSTLGLRAKSRRASLLASSLKNSELLRGRPTPTLCPVAPKGTDGDLHVFPALFSCVAAMGPGGDLQGGLAHKEQLPPLGPP